MSTDPSGCGGVGTAMKMTSDFSTPFVVLLVKLKRPAATFFDEGFETGLVDGDAATLEQLNLLASLSTQMT